MYNVLCITREQFLSIHDVVDDQRFAVWRISNVRDQYSKARLD